MSLRRAIARLKSDTHHKSLPQRDLDTAIEAMEAADGIADGLREQISDMKQDADRADLERRRLEEKLSTTEGKLVQANQRIDQLEDELRRRG